MQALQNAFAGLSRALEYLGRLVMLFMMLTISWDALARYLFNAPTSWSLEVNTFLIVYIAVVTAAELQRRDEHIRITFFEQRLGSTGRQITGRLIALVGLVFSAILAWRGWLLAYQAWEYDERVSSSFGTPMVFPYALLPIGFAALAVQCAIDLVRGPVNRDGAEPEAEMASSVSAGREDRGA